MPCFAESEYCRCGTTRLIGHHLHRKLFPQAVSAAAGYSSCLQCAAASLSRIFSGPYRDKWDFENIREKRRHETGEHLRKTPSLWGEVYSHSYVAKNRSNCSVIPTHFQQPYGTKASPDMPWRNRSLQIHNSMSWQDPAFAASFRSYRPEAQKYSCRSR